MRLAIVIGFDLSYVVMKKSFEKKLTFFEYFKGELSRVS